MADGMFIGLQRINEFDNIEMNAYLDSANVYRWRSNDAVVPIDIMTKAVNEAPAGHPVGRYDLDLHRTHLDDYTSRMIEEYRAARKGYVPSDEEMFEMRAAHGPGVTLVDILTGQKFHT